MEETPSPRGSFRLNQAVGTGCGLPRWVGVGWAKPLHAHATHSRIHHPPMRRSAGTAPDPLGRVPDGLPTTRCGVQCHGD